MVKWLENKDDVPSALEAWGLVKSIYTFKDLMNFLSNNGVLEEEKDLGKRKVKEKSVPKKVVQSNKKRRTS
jgi:hypothetical protein